MPTVTMKKNNTENKNHPVRSLYSQSPRKLSKEETSSIEETFPPVNPGFVPNGNRILIQLRSIQEKTKGGILLSEQSQEQALYEEQIGRVVAIGGSAFHNQTTMQPWPEGAWFDVGDFVRVPKFGGDKTWTASGEGKKTLFVIFRDYEVLGRIIGNPLEIKGYI